MEAPNAAPSNDNQAAAPVLNERVRSVDASYANFTRGLLTKCATAASDSRKIDEMMRTG